MTCSSAEIANRKKTGTVLEYLSNETEGIEQNKDGSSSEIRYAWSPSPDVGNVLIDFFRVVIVSPNVTDFLDYANRSALTTGLLIGSVVDGVDYPFVNVQKNVDFIAFNSRGNITSFEQKGNALQDGISLSISPLLPVIADASFQYYVIVRDDLTAVSYQVSSVLYQTLPPGG